MAILRNLTLSITRKNLRDPVDQSHQDARRAGVRREIREGIHRTLTTNQFRIPDYQGKMFPVRFFVLPAHAEGHHQGELSLIGGSCDTIAGPTATSGDAFSEPEDEEVTLPQIRLNHEPYREFA